MCMEVIENHHLKTERTEQGLSILGLSAVWHLGLGTQNFFKFCPCSSNQLVFPISWAQFLQIPIHHCQIAIETHKFVATSLKPPSLLMSINLSTIPGLIVSHKHLMPIYRLWSYWFRRGVVDGLILVMIPKFDMAQIKINATSKLKNIKIKYPRNQYLSSLGISLESTPSERKQT